MICALMLMGCGGESNWEAFRRRVEASVDPHELQSLLQEQVKDKTPGRHFGVSIAAFPKSVASLRPSQAQVFVAQRPTDSYVTVVYGGGFGHWGLLVGGDNFTPVSSTSIAYSHWTNRVWFFRETR
jgi:hypothetical protein